MQFRTKYFLMSISTTLFGKISHASLFITGQLRNPWQMLTEPWGSAEPRLKNTAIDFSFFQHLLGFLIEFKLWQ